MTIRRIGCVLIATFVAVSATAAPAATNVAVFNFQMTSKTPEWIWLEKFLSDQITTDFTRSEMLSVIARDEMQVMARKIGWVPEMATTDPNRMDRIRRRLRIEYIISGVYSVKDGRLEIAAQIVRVQDRRELLRKTATGKVDDLFNLQKGLSSELLSWFTRKPAEKILPTLPVWTRSIPAARALYEGMDLYDQGRYAEAWLKFRRSSRKDPAYVEAQYWVGKMYYFMNRYEHARLAIEKFVYMDESHPRMHDAALEYLHTFETRTTQPDELLEAYTYFRRRFPNTPVKIGIKTSDLDEWLKRKSARLLSRIGRHRQCVHLLEPPLYPAYIRNHLSILNVVAHNAITGNTLDRKILMSKSCRESLTCFKERKDEVTATFRPWTWVNGGSARILGKKHKNIDLTAMTCSTEIGYVSRLVAPSGYFFKSIRLFPLVKGDDGVLVVGVGRADENTLFYGKVKCKPLAAAKSEGVLWDKLPRSGYVRVDWRIRVKDAESSPPILVEGVKVVARLEKLGLHGAIDVSCGNTANFRVIVDGVCSRWYPGLVGLLNPGQHTVKLSPVETGTPFGDWTTKVTIRAGETTKVIGHLPWKPRSKWSNWSGTLVGGAHSGYDTNADSHAGFRSVATHIDEDAIRLIWSSKGELWCSVSTDGKNYSPPRKIALPVSSGWAEEGVRCLRDESGRFVLLFMSDRGARHERKLYTCWSRDFIHWSAPVLGKTGGGYIGALYDFIQDDRGRFILVHAHNDSLRLLASRDHNHWEVLSIPKLPDKFIRIWSISCGLTQRADGKYELFLLGYSRRMRKYVIFRYLSGDASTWSKPTVAGCWDYKGVSSNGLASIRKNGRTHLVVSTFSSESVHSSALLFSEGADGVWRGSKPVIGIFPGWASITHHPRWGYLIAWRLRLGNKSKLPHLHHPADGPFVMRGSDLEGAFGRRSAVTFSEQKVKPPTMIKSSFRGPGGATISEVRRPKSRSVKPLPMDAPLGKLRYFASNPIWADALVAKGNERFSKAPPGCGTTNPDALVVSFKERGLNIKVALDSTDPKSVRPTILRLDPTGKGDFKNAYVLKFAGFSNWGGEFKLAFAGKAEFSTGGRTIPVAARFIYIIRSTERLLVMKLAFGAQAICRFGNKNYRVCLRSDNCDISLGDATKIRPAGGRRKIDVTDRIFIGVGGKSMWSINNGKWEGFCGHPIFVDGVLYDLKISPDGSSIAATPYKGEVGTIRINHTRWEAELIGKKHIFYLSGNSKPVAIPPDRYALYSYSEWAGKDRRRLLVDYRDNDIIEVSSGKTIDIPIGSPITGKVSAVREGNAVEFKIEWKDVNGRSADITGLVPITIDIIDAHGKIVRTVRRPWGNKVKWKIPAGFKGTYSVSVTAGECFKAKIEKTTLSVE